MKTAHKILVAVTVIGLVTYGLFEYRFPSWTEQVRLPDGREISVKQRRNATDSTGTRRTWLTFSLPEMGGERTWSASLYPTMIGVADGSVYVIGRARLINQFLNWGFPKYGYVAFKWNGRDFERVSFMAVPEHLRQEENVRWCLTSGTDFRNKKGHNRLWCDERRHENDPYSEPKRVDLKMRADQAEYVARLHNQTTNDR